jgi:hypothetical protein
VSNESPEAGSGPLSGMPLLRFWSRELRWLGFCYGSPIHRATATFSFEDLKTALFDEEALTFTTTVERMSIRVYVTAVRECQVTQKEEFIRNDVFEHGAEERYWIVEGLLSVYHPVVDYAFAMADTREQEYNPRDRQEEEDMHVKVLAVVGFSADGQFAGAIVQRTGRPTLVPPSALT